MVERPRAVQQGFQSLSTARIACKQSIQSLSEPRARLFVSAVGIPPRWVVDKLHAAGIPVMNMIGAPKHVQKCLEAGVDLICAQGGEGGGHTGDVATSILIPSVVDLCKGHKAPLNGEPVYVVAAGGIYEGRGLAAALCWGAQAVWIGTRFVCATEAGAPPRHQQAIVDADYHDTVRTIIYTGRPMRVLKNEYILKWENERQNEIKELTAKGVIPVVHDLEQRAAKNQEVSPHQMMATRPMLMGQAAGAIKDVKPARDIINEMMRDAVAALQHSASLISPRPKL